MEPVPYINYNSSISSIIPSHKYLCKAFLVSTKQNLISSSLFQPIASTYSSINSQFHFFKTSSIIIPSIISEIVFKSPTVTIPASHVKEKISILSSIILIYKIILAPQPIVLSEYSRLYLDGLYLFNGFFALFLSKSLIFS